MEKEFIPYEQALALKELGFDEPCFAYYRDGRITGVNKWDREDWGFHVMTNKEITNITSEIVIAPTFSQAFRFFRDKYGLWQIVPQNTDIDWTYDILPINGIHDYSLIDVFETYEEAELECLKKLIEIVKNGKH